MSNEEKEILKAIISSIPLMILAVVVPILAAYGYQKPNSESLTTWFQRSGSITVMFSVWSEYNLAKINEHINLSGVIIEEQSQLSDKYGVAYRIARYLGALCAITGTVIWGYGDLLMHLLNKA